MSAPVLKPKDLKSDVEVKWCAGCGAHSILHSLQTAISNSGVKQENVAVISGIGCSSRLPYYIKTYGMHSIHGRAAAIATGVKTANPELQVWQISGDGDSMAIGGNHFIHSVKRNIDMNVVIFNNEIYGLTKGQFSPTTKQGEITKTSPQGHIEKPFNPGELTIGAQGNFFARSLDSLPKFTADLLLQSEQHKGTSVCEVLMNCVIFNDGAHKQITDKNLKAENQILLEHGKPMIFGENLDKGLVFEDFKLKVVKIGEDGYTKDNILVHDAHMESPVLHSLLVKMMPPAFPVALGVIRRVDDVTYEKEMERLIAENQHGVKNTKDLFNSGDVWDVE